MTDNPITFTDEQGNEQIVMVGTSLPRPFARHATPDDLARAWYLRDDSPAITKIRSELRALRALEKHIRSQLTDAPRCIPVLDLLKAVDEARK